MLPAQLLQVGSDQPLCIAGCGVAWGRAWLHGHPVWGAVYGDAGAWGKARGMQLDVQRGLISEDVIPFPHVPQRNES